MSSETLAVPTRPQTTPRAGRRSLVHHRLPYALLLPALALLSAVVVYPVGYGLWLAFNEKSLLSLDATFVGIDNFRELLSDNVFLMSVRHTVQWTVLGVVGVMLVGLLLALILNSRYVIGGRWLRSLYFLPWLTPTVVTAIVWSWLYNPTYGYINHALMELGLIDAPLLFLSKPGLNLNAVVAPLIWRGYPFTMLVILAALQSIDQALYEAASIDGAGAWQRFRSITLPSLAPSLAILTLLQTIWIFNHFDIPYQMTAGGPAHTSELLSTYAYNTVFAGTRQGYGAAVATVMFMVLVVFGTIYIRLAVRRSEELTG
jgi:multiple sugar transport system permease protein